MPVGLTYPPQGLVTYKDLGSLGATCYVIASDAKAEVKRFAQILQAAGYPCYVCDGVADNVEIQAAIDALPAGGGKVVLSEGQFNIAASISISKSYTTLMGAGGHYDINADAGGGTILALNNNVNDDVIKLASNIDCIRITDLVVNGNAANQTAGRGIDGSGTGTGFLRVERVAIYRTKEVGIMGTAQGGDAVVDCLVRQAGTLGIDSGGPTLYMAGCFFTGCSYGGRIYSYEASVVGCTFDDCSHEGLILSQAHITVTGSRFINNRGRNIEIAGGFKGVVVVGNIIQLRPGTATAYGIFMNLTVADIGILVEGNTIDCDAGTNGTSAGIYVTSSVASTQYIKIRGNHIEGFSGAGGVGINIASANILAAEIEGNTIENCTSPIANSGTSTKIARNQGYVTENSGTATITAGQTSVNVTHGLATTPTRVVLTPTTDTAGRRYWVSAKGATTFTITIDSTHTADITFDWRAQVGEG
jgi:hypothetical protein